MFKNLPVNRLFLYAILIGLIPFLVVMIFFFSEKGELEEIQEKLENIKSQAFLKEKKQAINLAVRQHFSDVDHFYIDKCLETLVFLEPEIELLQKTVQDKNFADDEIIKRRLEYLTSSSNSMIFAEGVIQAFPLFQEIPETLVHPVEVNLADLQKILSRIEGVKVGPFEPCPLVTEFKLDKKKLSEKNEVYLLNLKLLKREFL